MLDGLWQLLAEFGDLFGDGVAHAVGRGADENGEGQEHQYQCLPAFESCVLCEQVCGPGDDHGEEYACECEHDKVAYFADEPEQSADQEDQAQDDEDA